MTIKEELKKIICKNCPRFPIGLGLATSIDEKEISKLAQAIIDRLEIDVDGILEVIYTSDFNLKLSEGGVVRQDRVLTLARAITKAKPIKLKEEK